MVSGLVSAVSTAHVVRSAPRQIVVEVQLIAHLPEEGLQALGVGRPRPPVRRRDRGVRKRRAVVPGGQLGGVGDRGVRRQRHVRGRNRDRVADRVRATGVVSDLQAHCVGASRGVRVRRLDAATGRAVAEGPRVPGDRAIRIGRRTAVKRRHQIRRRRGERCYRQHVPGARARDAVGAERGGFGQRWSRIRRGRPATRPHRQPAVPRCCQ